ncbi:MAG: hypothetical protein P4L16_02295 [Chlamydiales bacterium]|nr:hypothetical protein [Chlamydiales bacterium]
MNLQESTQEKEGSCLVSKWLELPLLLSFEEMERCFTEIGPCFIVYTDRIVGENEGVISPEQFLDVYKHYLQDLQEGKILNNPVYKKAFQGIITTTLDAVYAIRIDASRRIIKTRKPTLLLQPYRIEYSSFDGKFRPMVMSQNSLLWGIQISYPQLFQDSKTGVLEKIGPSFVNTEAFRRLQKWVRYNTQPTTFLIDEVRQVTMPMRIGKEAHGFVNNHHGLKERALRVIVRGGVL